MQAWDIDKDGTDGFYFGYWKYSGSKFDDIWGEIERLNRRMQTIMNTDDTEMTVDRTIFPQSGSTIYMQWEYAAKGSQWFSHEIRLLASRRWSVNETVEPLRDQYANIREWKALDMFYKAMDAIRNIDSWERSNVPICLDTLLMAVGLKSSDVMKEPE